MKKHTESVHIKRRKAVLKHYQKKHPGAKMIWLGGQLFYKDRGLPVYGAPKISKPGKTSLGREAAFPPAKHTRPPSTRSSLAHARW